MPQTLSIAFGTPAARDSPFTKDVPPRSRGAMRPSFAQGSPSKIRGRRECRVRAAPAVSCARCTRKCAHEHTGSAEASGIPCAMALRLMPCSPRRRIRLVTVVGGFATAQPGRVELATADLAPATGVRTTRFCRTLKRRSSCTPANRSRGSTRPATSIARRRSRVHHIPSRVRDDARPPLFSERDGRS